MRTSVIILLAALTLLTTVTAAVQPIAIDDARIKTLGSADRTERIAASEKLIPAQAAAVVPLLAVMDKNTQPAAKMAYDTLFRIVQQAAGTDAAPPVAEELGRELMARDPSDRRKLEHAVTTGRNVCRLLSHVGGDKAIDDLYRTMNRPELAEMARWALSRIPGRRATQALIGATQIMDLDGTVAVVTALGQRGDPYAASMLQALATTEEDSAIRTAALDAVARIPAPGTLDVLTNAVKENRDRAIAAMLTFVETLLDTGAPQDAARGLRTLAELSSLTVAERCRMLHAWGRIGGDEGTRFILATLDTQDAHICGAALQACAVLEGKKATVAVARKMTATKGSLKANLLDALGQRGKWMDDASAVLIAKAVTDPDEDIRVAAICAIETTGAVAGTMHVLRALAGPTGRTRDAAEHAINHMPGQQVTKQIIDNVASAPPETRAMLLLALGHRGGEGVLPVLIKHTEDKDPRVRVAAIKAMGTLGSEGALDALWEALKGQPGPERDAAEVSMRRLPGEMVTGKLLTTYGQAADTAKPVLLRVIGRRKNPDVARLLSKEVKSANPSIRAAAVDGLSRQDDPGVAATLATVARQGPVEVTRAAMAGYPRAARRTEGADKAAAGKMYIEAIKLAVTDDQRRTALDGIERTVKPTRIDLLPIIVPLMNEGNVRKEAAVVVSRLAEHLPKSHKKETIELMTAVIEANPKRDAIRRAVDHLRKLGIDADPARDAGFITSWWLIGPFPNPGSEMFTRSYFPEQQIDLDARKTVAGKELVWHHHRTNDLRGIVDLDSAVIRKEEVGAYGYAEITVDADRNVVLEMGSDDGIVVWVNGKKVHANNAHRGVKADQDHANARLEAGVNKVLVKIINGSAAWGFCLRITTPDGQPVTFKQRMK